MYRGINAVALRDIPGFAIYFYLYERLKLLGEQNNFWSDDDVNIDWKRLLWTMNAGGMAGAFAWIVETPPDMIKTRQQAYSG